MPLGGVGDDFADVVLRVETAVRGLVPQFGGAVAVFGARAPGAHFGEPGVALDLDAPALVVGEVEVEDVQFVGGQQIEHAQHAVLGHEMPRHVEHQTTPAEARAVLDLGEPDLRGGGAFPRARRADGRAAERLGAEELAEGLRSPEHSGRAAPGEPYALGGRHGQPVALGLQRGIDAQLNGVRGPVRRGAGGEWHTEGRAERGAQPAFRAPGAGARREGRGPVEDESAPGAAPAGAYRCRDQVVHTSISPSPRRRVRRPDAAVRGRRRPGREWSSRWRPP